MIVVGSQEPLWAAVLQPARVISTSCVHVLKIVCFSKTERCTATNTEILSVERYSNNSSFFILCVLFISVIIVLYCSLHECPEETYIFLVYPGVLTHH